MAGHGCVAAGRGEVALEEAKEDLVDRRRARVLRGAVLEQRHQIIGREVVERAKEMREVDGSSSCRTAGASAPQRCRLRA
jgi:hypothetical protein